MRIAFDTIVVIALADNQPSATHLRPLHTLHREEKVTLFIGVSMFLEGAWEAY
jgi:hypothetical protein